MSKSMRIGTEAAIAVVTVLAAGAPAPALINPSLQPGDLADRARATVRLRVAKVDYETNEATAEVLDRIGTFKPETVTFTTADNAGVALILSLAEGQEIVAFAGRTKKRFAKQCMLYVGGGSWVEAELADADKPDTWVLLRNPDADKDPSSSRIMFGTFNGRVEKLWEFAEDHAAGRAYFPSRPFGSFEMCDVGTLEDPVTAVALADLDADGNPEWIAASESAIAAWGRSEDGRHRLAAPEGGADSLAAGDADGDGDVDLLADDRLWLAEDGAWTRDEALPAADGELIVSTLADLDGDGRLDVVYSLAGGGLRVFRRSETGWTDATTALGLAGTKDAGGWIDVGHWNDDGHPDLVYTNADRTLLFVGGGKRSARSLRGGRGFSEHTGQKQAAPALGALWKPSGEALAINWESGSQLLAPVNSGAEDVTDATNEFQEPIGKLVMSLAKDFNADGRTDVLLIGDKIGGVRLQVNRRYGSYMMVSKYSKEASLPSSLSACGPVCAAAGDVDGDGDVDVLFGCQDGSVLLAWNRTMENRPDKPSISTNYHQRKRIGAHSIRVRFTSKLPGVRGALLTARDKDGATVWRATIGGNVGNGTSGPLSATVVLREPGEYRLLLRTTDGRSREIALKLPDRPEGTMRLVVFK